MTTDTATTSTVTSRDGTPIAWWSAGEGPPLVLVHGTTADHTRWAPLLPHLEPHHTVHALDRRGRGGSGDTPPYDVHREFEDVAAVIEAVADLSQQPVAVYGHSYGALCTLGAATLTDRIGRLALYEPPLDPADDGLPQDVGARLDAYLAAGEAEQALITFMTEVVRMPAQELDAYRAMPTWPTRVAATHTVPRELRSVPTPALDVERVARRVQVPALLFAGTDSPPWMREDIRRLGRLLPDARLVALPGQRHVADVMIPEVFARHLLEFLGGTP